jgi:2,4-dienoyl-CoA reductase-like NADH-dependent reductase (Old Yellow Enzyme family)
MAIGGIGLDRGYYDSRRDGRAGGADNIRRLLERFERGEFDLVAVGRALLNEPSWTTLLRHGQELPAFDEATLSVLR